MRFLALLFFHGYVAILLLAGGSGIVIAEWELKTFFDIDFDAMNDETQATILNQYRFLKSMELGFGLFCLLFRKEIFKQLPFLRLFLLILFVGVGARTLSVVVDGLPHWAYLVFTILEFIAGVLVYVYARKTLKQP